jgi:hypothetical protein
MVSCNASHSWEDILDKKNLTYEEQVTWPDAKAQEEREEDGYVSTQGHSVQVDSHYSGLWIFCSQ